MIEEGLVNKLESTGAVAALVSDRIYPVILPQEPTYPAITYTRVGDFRHNTFEGQNQLLAADFQIDAWGDTYSDARELADEIRQALNNSSGNWGSHYVYCCRIAVGPIDIYEDAVESFRCTYSYSVWVDE